MATFKAQVESWVGTVSDTTSLDFWLQAAARHIINLVPAYIFESNSTVLYDDGTGASTSGYRVLGANRDGYIARPVSSDNRGGYADDESLFRSTLKSPCYYTNNELTFVLPDGGEIKVVPYPVVVNTDSVIQYFPDQLEPAVALWAAIQVKIKELTTAAASSSALSLTMPTPPTALTGTPITIGAFGTPPTYTAPAAPTIDAYSTAVEPALTTYQDIELAQGYLQKIQTELQEYQIRLQDSLGEFNEMNVEYQSSLQRAFNQATLDEQHAIEVVRLNVAIYSANVQGVVGEYQAKIGGIFNLFDRGIAQVQMMRGQFAEMLAPFMPPPQQPRYVGKGVVAE